MYQIKAAPEGGSEVFLVGDQSGNPRWFKPDEDVYAQWVGRSDSDGSLYHVGSHYVLVTPGRDNENEAKIITDDAAVTWLFRNRHDIPGALTKKADQRRLTTLEQRRPSTSA